MLDTLLDHFSRISARDPRRKVPFAWVGAAGLSAGLLWAAPAIALTITQTESFVIPGSTPVQFSFNQFDPSLGTLTEATLSFSGTTTGSLRLKAATYQVTALSLSTTFGWLDQPLPSVDTSVNITSSTNRTLPYAIASTSTAAARTFTIQGTAPVSTGSSLYSSSQDLSSFIGTGQVSGELQQSLLGTVSITPTPLDLLQLNSLSYSGSDPTGGITLTYTYDPTPVPAAFPIVGAVLSYSFLRRQRRRVKFPL